MTITLHKGITRFIISNKILLLTLLLTIVAALPRLYHLGDLGFYMDEETTSFASKSMAEGKGPQMPSGMPYYRSLPHIWLNSISAKIFGIEKEYSYRLPAALLGMLTVPLIFLFARPYVGTSVAFLAALLLALSEWQIITSRQARMYAPFLFFYIACSFAILRWAKKDTLYSLALTITLFIVAVSFHQLGVFLAFIPLIALFTKDYATTPQYKLILFSIITGITAYLYGDIFVSGPYSQWKETYGITTANAVENKSLLQNLTITGLQLTYGMTGFLLGLWLAIKSVFTDHTNGREFRILARYTLATLLGTLAAIGHLHGAFLSFLMLLLLYPEPLNHYLQRTWKPLIAISTVAAITAILTIAEHGIVPGIKLLLSFPYPNWITLNTLSSGITLLFILALLYLAVIKKTTSNSNVRILLVISLFPLILVGIFMKWAPARYLIQAYPFILIVCAYALYTPAHKFFQPRYTNAGVPALVLACLVSLSGLLGGHGLISAFKVGTVEYGDRLNEAALIFPFYPDHKSPGEYVAEHRSAGDIIIAEDVLEQRWYAGRVDYWLRNYEEEAGFLYLAADNELHDIYVDSIAATPTLLSSLLADETQRFWLITSGETYTNRQYYLNENQREWLSNLETSFTPVFTGKDNVTQVYCIHCNDNNL